MTSSINVEVTKLTSDSEMAPTKTYRGIRISLLFNTCPLNLGSKQSWQSIRKSSSNDDFTILTAHSGRGPSITYKVIIIS